MKDEFFSAITQGDVAKVKALLGADGTLAQAKDQNGLSAILKATYYRKKDVVAALLETGMELNIFEAAATGETERVLALLKEDPSLAKTFSPDGFMPLGLAVFFGHRQIVDALLDAGAEVNAKMNDGKTPLGFAVERNQKEMVDFLRKRGAK